MKYTVKMCFELKAEGRTNWFFSNFDTVGIFCTLQRGYLDVTMLSSVCQVREDRMKGISNG